MEISCGYVYVQAITPVKRTLMRDQKDIPELCQAVSCATAYLSENSGWLHSPTKKDTFLLKFLNNVCESCPSVSLTDSNYEHKIANMDVLAPLYKIVANKMHYKFPFLRDVPSMWCKNPDARRYFGWIGELQYKFSEFQKSFKRGSLTYADAVVFKENFNSITRFALSVNCGPLVVQENEIDEYKTSFQKESDCLNSLLIKYLTNDPKAGW